MLRKSILVISDQHAPYHHIDTLDFLKAIKLKYKPDCVVNIGDEMDWHSISFHDSHPGLYSPSHELVVARKFLQDLEKLFPKQHYGMCTVQGHYHTSFKIDYWSNPNELLWGMQVGCLINMKSLAFEYNKLQKSRPVIGTGVIIDGLPILIPMVLDKNGRWNRKIT